MGRRMRDLAARLGDLPNNAEFQVDLPAAEVLRRGNGGQRRGGEHSRSRRRNIVVREREVGRIGDVRDLSGEYDFERSNLTRLS